MSRFGCDNSFQNDMKEYAGSILLGYGGYSPSAEREIMCLTDAGNLIAAKMYGDLVFYGKILRRDKYREAFNLYLKSAGISIGSDGQWSLEGRSYPMAFFSIAFYLVNYGKGSVLKDCKSIDIIGKMPDEDRYLTALELTLSCLTHVDAPGAVNLIGRILHEASVNEALYNKLKPVIEEDVSSRDFEVISLSVGKIENMAACGDASELFFEAAASKGYVYACNNLAAREAGHILSMHEEGADKERIREEVEKYIGYLKLSADRYEPYAANRLGMLYINGVISSGDREYVCRELTDRALAKAYFKKATVYPDLNSAWAFYNLIKYFHKDYDNDIELMNEHMEYIRRLNPKVYDLAIEL